MPRIHVQETSNEVDAIGGHQSNQDDTTTGRAEEGRQELADTLAHIEVQGTSCEGILDQVEGQDQDVALHNTEINEGNGISQARTTLVSRRTI